MFIKQYKSVRKEFSFNPVELIYSTSKTISDMSLRKSEYKQATYL